ncbi:hypothetical protein F2P56_033179 [Juglans regia]|uniref:RNase H type-1 domain-containing protein n=1 Tax=Juglans regia TaxID=51240 RepID=A0A833X809_JUGRE|nr:hypothetical protein F2P56_033179 [Juglans regia]
MEGYYDSVEAVWLSIKDWLRRMAETLSEKCRLSTTGQELLQAMEVPFKISSERSPRIIYWQRPPEGWVKLNVDGSCRGNPGPSGGGGLIRDRLGVVQVAFSVKFVLLPQKLNQCRQQSPPPLMSLILWCTKVTE